jgi:hypothetical protein
MYGAFLGVIFATVLWLAGFALFYPAIGLPIWEWYVMWAAICAIGWWMDQHTGRG